MEPVKIATLEVENVKRVRAVSMTPTANGLTVIGGGNGEGKTSVLDAIAWALGGDKYRPSSPEREGSIIPPHIHIKLSNGIEVERKGKNAALTVVDTTGRKGGQQLLNEFVEQLAIDLPRFLQSSNRDKADALLKIIGVGEQLAVLDRQAKELYNQRTYVGRDQLSKAKHAEELPEYLNVPDEPISPSNLIRQQQEILLRNAKNREYRDNAASLESRYTRLSADIEEAKQRLSQMHQEQAALSDSLNAARKTVQELHDESTEALEASIRDVEETNAKVRANLDRQAALDAAAELDAKYKELTAQLERVRDQRVKLLDGAQLPLPGLSVEDGEITYNGARWDCMAASEQLRVSAAIVRQLNPKCGFVLIDKLEQMDSATMQTFGAWLEQEGLQAIATRVSTGSECSIIIEDGYGAAPGETAAPKWKGGSL